MTCDQTSEHLPWLLNGTLDGEERQDVEEHLRSCAACRRALAETRLAWEVFDQHVPSERLVAYAWGDPGVDRAEIERHLESCSQCAAELELTGISRRLEAAEDQKVPLLVPAARRKTAPARIWRSSAIAASLVGLIAASGWIESSRRLHSLAEDYAARRNAPAPAPTFRGAPPASAARLREAQDRVADLTRRNQDLAREVEAQGERQKKYGEQLGQLERSVAAAAGKQPAIADIAANGVTISPQALRSVERGAQAGSEVRAVPRSAPFAVLTFTSGRAESAEGYGGYELAVVDAAGKEVRRLRNVRPDADGQFVLTLRKGALAPGSYTLQLYGLRAGQPVPLDGFPLRIE